MRIISAMDPHLMIALILVGVFAGVIGAMFGMGGGIIFIPVLTIFFGLSAGEAVAVSLVGIIASSVGAASSYVKCGRCNIRLGLLLAISTALGALLGATLAGILKDWVLLSIFACVLLYSSVNMLRSKERIIRPADDDQDSLVFAYTDDKGTRQRYKVENIGSGLAWSGGIGVLSSLTGVGGGSLQVPLMNSHMHIPIKVASATSNYMIGITAMAGVLVFFINGYVLLDCAASVAIGAFAGSMLGIFISGRVRSASLRKYLAFILIAVAASALLKAGGIL